MPLGIRRLNARHLHPNDRIIFIKPLPGPSSAIAEDFLNRIAAICVPIMRANSLSIMTLEEHEPNREFVGRNFNAGEVIQLVLKAPGTGRWLPFRYVQMVMMHELAHCKEMNHSRAFWAVRNQHADELRLLWAKHYEGDGLWGRGQALYSGQYTEEGMPGAEIMPANLCGGTYRSRRSGGKRKRKSEPNSTYAERRQKWIEKKFGAGGTALGDDTERRVALEHGKTKKGKPRVAGSQRGRELRAAAALARFETGKPKCKKQDDHDTIDDFDDYSDYDEPKIKEEASDHDGQRLLDANGNGMFRVCDVQDETDPNAQHELEELGKITNHFPSRRNPLSDVEKQALISEEDVSTASEDEGLDIDLTTAPIEPVQVDTNTGDTSESTPCHNRNREISSEPRGQTADSSRVQTKASSSYQTAKTSPAPVASADLTFVCAVCSLENEPDALTCLACSHVLCTERMPRYWHCMSEICRGGNYVNADDAGSCGVCGANKPSVS